MSVGRAWLRRAYKAARSICRTNERLARAWHFSELRRLERRYERSPVIVYQMGKVGSTTVMRSLSESKLGRRIYHTHALDPALNAINEAKAKAYPGREPKLHALERVWTNQYLYERLSSKPLGEPWQAITLVRDPVARNLGTFFQHVEILDETENAWRVRALSYEFELTVPKNDLSGLSEMFFERCRHGHALGFFDREFKGLWEIDVFADPFPKQRGFRTYDSDRLSVLLIRLEDLDRCGDQALAEFLNQPDIALVNTNVGSDKPYAEMYSLFKRTVELPETYLDEMYESKLAKHFYTQAEIERFRDRWLRRSAP